MIQITINGLDRVEKFIAELPNQLDKEIMVKSEEFMAFVQKMAKIRAPKNTGFLADQIKISKKGKEITLDTGEAYYAYYQEFGFTPHPIPLEFMNQHKSLSPNIPGQFVPNAFNFKFVKKYTPFIIPSLEQGIANLPMMLKSGINNAIKRSGGKNV